ncbi:MAG TPA: PASTA domain-containing protein [Bacteroidetes bacterium]|nr:PASTA domain-containing protein [Bacteroidota bacterium]
MVKPGRRIEIVVSRSESMTTCPDVIGRSPREAAITADSVGLMVDPQHTRYRHSNSYPEGVVMFQRPEPNREMNRDEELFLTVSLGKRPTAIVAPDLVGRKFESVGITLTKYNLRLGRVEKFPNRSVAAGTVLTQDPLPGTPMKSGERISLSIAVKPSSNQPPDTTGNTASMEEMEVE